MIEFTCEGCGRALRVGEDFAGMPGTCKWCGRRVTVPMTFAELPPYAEEAPDVVFAAVWEGDAAGFEPQLPARTSISARMNARLRAQYAKSLGAASATLGGVALLACGLPWGGLAAVVLAALGVVLGISGVIVGSIRVRQGIAVPAAGATVAIAALVVAARFAEMPGGRRANAGEPVSRGEPAARVETEPAPPRRVAEPDPPIKPESAPKRAAAPGPDVAPVKPDVVPVKPDVAPVKVVAREPVAEPDPVPVGEPAVAPDIAPGDAAEDWAGAGNTAQGGDVRVRVLAVSIGTVEVEDADDPRSLDEKVLKFELRIENVNDVRKVDYESWSGSGGGLKHLATLRDDVGNTYQRVNYGLGSRVVGQAQHRSLTPGGSMTDLLLFEVPVAKAESLRLRLPAGAYGGEGVLRIQVPRVSVIREAGR